ncbi:fumarylacetoacetate hydrolase family protein [Metallosphaera tengchongensis]|uniref:Fumarylacetoacetate hydrolase family protein n=1 Tax=Metallosphaera tengchongensis TaxID=1532350 RepID=A0A6N0NVB3_9CREN|nr:fumarylacetoacetate hydrolase family protein [Metallosphaera tengchongensis]QKQ99099.1 fumarylacetoacetate hydrolase family protein [Metallosphaera tengchongensis]
MKFFTFKKGGLERVGVLKDGKALDLYEAYRKLYETVESPGFLLDLKKLISLGKPALEVAKELEAEWPLEAELGEIDWQPPITSPDKVLCPAVNYRAHGQEVSTPPPSKPYFFTKFASSLVGHEKPVVKHKIVNKLDWEVELGIVIGKPGEYIDVRRALDYVFGFTVLNDVSARDWQFPEGWPKVLNPYGQNWVWGKAMDRSTPVGPVVVTKDEVQDPNSLSMSLKVNGFEEQRGNTRDLIFKVEELVSWASMGITLVPGDIISTGTPPGVGYAKGKFLKVGDVMEATVEGVGTIRNRVVEE